jgi:uncharacterized protein
MNIPVRDKKELITRLQKNSTRLRSFGIDKLGLFGSFARNVQIDKSDVDLLVDFLPGQKNFDNLIELSFFLEDLLGRKVELVTRKSLSPYIGPYILKSMENVELRA